jgi:hypothetical protein
MINAPIRRGRIRIINISESKRKVSPIQIPIITGTDSKDIRINFLVDMVSIS